MSETVRVFVNAAGVDVPRGATALDAVRAWRPAEADAVAAGSRAITDSRGLPLPADAPMPAGAILRTIANRDAGDSAPDPEV
ncbi:MAG TPA: hypothetical protein VF737_02765 [Gemmatimonadaceae bacterium]